ISRCDASSGAGINNRSNLTVMASAIESCRVMAGDQDGGGIWSSGALVISGCTISNCVGAFWGGGIRSARTLAMTNSRIIDNNIGATVGGGLFLGGTNILVNCTIARNRSADGGGIYHYGNNSQLRLIGCTISANLGEGDGTGIRNGQSSNTN